MRTSVIAALLLAAPVSTAVQAQEIDAVLAVRTGAIAGHIAVGPDRASHRRPTARRVIVVERHAPRVVVVERVHRHRPARYWLRRGYQPVTLYYVHGRYYDHWAGHWPDRYRVVVWERNGRYLDDCGYDRYERRRHHHDRHHDYWDD